MTAFRAFHTSVVKVAFRDLCTNNAAACIRMRECSVAPIECATASADIGWIRFHPAPRRMSFLSSTRRKRSASGAFVDRFKLGYRPIALTACVRPCLVLFVKSPDVRTARLSAVAHALFIRELVVLVIPAVAVASVRRESVVGFRRSAEVSLFMAVGADKSTCRRREVVVTCPALAHARRVAGPAVVLSVIRIVVGRTTVLSALAAAPVSLRGVVGQFRCLRVV